MDKAYKEHFELIDKIIKNYVYKHFYDGYITHEDLIQEVHVHIIRFLRNNELIEDTLENLVYTVTRHRMIVAIKKMNNVKTKFWYRLYQETDEGDSLTYPSDAITPLAAAIKKEEEPLIPEVFWPVLPYLSDLEREVFEDYLFYNRMSKSSKRYDNAMSKAKRKIKKYCKNYVDK